MTKAKARRSKSSGASQKPSAPSQKGKKNKNVRRAKHLDHPPVQRPQAPATKVAPPAATAPSKAKRKLSGLEQIRERLMGGRFRMLNEQLYTTAGNESFSRFQEEPDLFDQYHEGYRHQVSQWPVNPLDTIIDELRAKTDKLVVADFGCGEGRLAESVAHTVHSFDLVAARPHITACNIAHVPLADASADVAVFCLSLMGTDCISFLREAWRVLKPGGTLRVAEVRSRFESMPKFIKAVDALGFRLESRDIEGNKMFAHFTFTKAGAPKTSKRIPHALQLLKPCIYKRR